MAELKHGVGRYEILGELGRGGMSTVYLARQEELDRLVALKELAAFRDSDPSFARRFFRQAQAVGPWTDLYSVGVMAFEFFIGHPPFSDADNALSVLLRQVNEEIPPVW